MNFSSVLNYEGLYEVSDCGVVRSVDRIIVGRDGVTYPRKGRVLRQSPHKDTEYPQVSLWAGNVGTSFYVHRLVALAHIPNPEDKPEVNHKDGVRSNNAHTNLEWVTSLENKLHAIGEGLRVYTTRLTKEEFVDCLYAVIEGESYSSLTTRVPYKVPFLSTKVRKLAQELGLEGELDESLYLQRVTRARINGAKNQHAH